MSARADRPRAIALNSYPDLYRTFCEAQEVYAASPDNGADKIRYYNAVDACYEQAAARTARMMTRMIAGA